MTRIYISGPITGMPDLNKPAFDYQERLLREAGYEVFNPQTIPFPAPNVLAAWEEEEKIFKDPGFAKKSLWQYFMRVCVGQLPLCDEIIMLPGWENSKGAVEERRIAVMLGMYVQYASKQDSTNW